jgi:uncharacterized protein (DUF433 family)
MAAPLIQSDPNVMMGKPVVAGTRIPVELVREKLAAGETVDQLLEAHPRLTKEGIRAALQPGEHGAGQDGVSDVLPLPVSGREMGGRGGA